MAKRKTPKVKNLGTDKITTEELENLQALVRAIQESQSEIGMIETRKHHILHSILELQEMLSKLRETFKEKYGTGDINIQDGFIRKQEDEQADS